MKRILFLHPRILVTDDLVFSTSSDRTARVWYNDHEEHPKALIRTLKVTIHAADTTNVFSNILFGQWPD